MGQCVCGQYFNPGEAQCRFCGRMLQEGNKGYDYQAYQQPWAQGVGQNAQGVPGVGQNAQGVPGVGQNAQGIPGVGQNAQAMQGAGQSAQGIPGVGQSAQGASASATKGAKAEPYPEILAILRTLKRRSLIQTIATIAGFVIVSVASIWMLLIVFAMAESFKG